MCRVEMFGGLRLLHSAGGSTRFATQKTAALLAYLAYHRGRDVPRELLLEMLWPGVDPASSRNRLSVALSAIRKIFEEPCGPDALVTTRYSIRLDPEFVSTDVGEFDALIDGSLLSVVGGPPTMALLTRINELYQGPLLDGFYDDWIEPERRRLADHFVAAAGVLIGQLRSDGHFDRAIGLARRVIVWEPYLERAHRDLMQLYTDAGRPSEAVRLFRELEQRMSDDLGIALSAETRAALPSPSSVLPLGSKKTVARARREADAPLSGPLCDKRLAAEREPENSELREPRTDEVRVQVAPKITRNAGPRRTIRLLMGIAALGVLATGVFHAMRRPSSPIASASVVQDFHKPAPPDASGRLIWSAQYHAATDEMDSEPSRTTIDAAGNTYIVGFVQTQKNDIDYLTLKYSPVGKLLWRRRWNGETNDCDRGRYVAVDPNGNVYVVGESYHGDLEKGGTQYDIVTLKYDPNGNLLWHHAFDGQHSSDDIPLGLGLDQDGNVYVTGMSRAADKTGSYVILKYDSEGQQQWVQKCEPDPDAKEPAEITLRDSLVQLNGDICLTGEAVTKDGFGKNDLDSLTARFDHNGNLLWRRRYSGDARRNDKGWRIASDGQGGLLMAGTADKIRQDGSKTQDELALLVKYDLTGREVWRNLRNTYAPIATPSSVTVDDQGAVTLIMLIGAPPDRTVVFRYSPSGELVWQRSDFHIPSFTLVSNDAVMGRKGTVYLAGSIFRSEKQGTPPPGDFFLEKLDDKGSTLWQKIYRGPVNDDRAQMKSVKIDSYGSILITGQAGGGVHRDIFLLKYVL